MTTQISKVNNAKLQLNPITLDEDYLKEWNESSRDFVCLAKGDEILNNCVYRVGGMGSKDIEGKRYFKLLKHVEELYGDNITKDKKRKKHLASYWTIIDSNGVEKFVSEKFFNHPYLIDNAPIYSVGSNYYNIETGELYCYSSSKMESSEYVFLENNYDNDHSRRGVMRISKKDGSYEIFK